MTSILEQMAKAAYDRWSHDMQDRELEPPWEELEESFQVRMIDAQSAALTVLAESDLPDAAIEAAVENWSNPRDVFRAIIRAIIEEQSS